ncbi:MAG: DUF58 domain-containing protein [Acidobacteria bacterium]|nr:DUF58 domain-containing protein [Acidobacteriota bacterium]
MPTAQSLSPALVAAVDDLEVVARLIVEGMRSGQHRSPFHGFSTEFSQYRAYRPGDDLKYLDWKVLARTDRLYTRQFRQTTNMSAVICLDSSASMAYPDTGLSKFHYAKMMAAALSHLIVTQGDAVGLMTMQAGRLVYLPARGGRGHLRTVLAQIDRLEPAGAWEPQTVITRAADLLRRRGLVCVISDFYDAPEATQVELRRANRRGHDVSLLQVVSKQEVNLPFVGDLDFEDLETGARVLLDLRAARAAYRDRMAAFLEGWRSSAKRDGFDYALMTTDESPAEALRGYLLRRGATP